MTDAALAQLAPQRIPLFVDSVQIPQANALPRVVEMVRARTMYGCAYGVPGFDHPRDRAFYTRAAVLLGLLDEHHGATLLGWRILHASSRDAHALLRLAFERSAVGAAWLEWVGVRITAALCASTAEAFLRDCTPLAPSTVERRAMTLRAWLEYLQSPCQEAPPSRVVEA